MTRSVFYFIASAGLSLLPVISLAVNPTADELKNPQWWFAQATESAAKISEAEDRAMVRQLISAAQGQLAPPQELTKSIETQREKFRAFGADAEWQFELFAAQQYEAASRYREALDAWKRARRLAQSRIDEEKRNEKPGAPYDPRTEEVRFRFRMELDSIGSNAISHGELAVAFEAVECADDDAVRDTLLERIANHQAGKDVQAAEITLRKLSPKSFQRTWRDFLINQCVSGKREQYERAIRQFLDDRPAMTPNNTSSAYTKLAFFLAKLPHDVDPELIRRLESILEGDLAASSPEALRDEATICRAALFIGQERWSEARAIANRSGEARVVTNITAAVMKRLVELKKLDEAAQYSPSSQDSLMQIARGYLDANQPDKALVIIEKFPSLDGGYEYFAVDAGKQFAELDQWSKIDRVVAALDTAAGKIRVLCKLSGIARNLGKPQEAAEFLRQAVGLVQQISNADERDQILLQLANIYAEAGDFRSAQTIAEQHGDYYSRAFVLAAIAEKQIALNNKLDDFRTTLGQFHALAERATANPRGDRERERYRQLHLGLTRAWLCLLANDRINAAEAISKGFNATKDVPGSFWRFEVYGEFFLTKQSPSDLGKIATMSELVPTAIDRAIIECIGGTLATTQLANK